MDTATEEYTVYKLFDRERNPLYVGCTRNLDRRLGQHRLQTHWFEDVAEVETETFADPREAGTAEVERIRTLSPRHNKTHNTRYACPQPPAPFYLDGDKLRLLRILRGEAQHILAKRSGLSAYTVYALERRVKNERFHPSTLTKLADALGVEPRALVEDEREQDRL